MQSSSSWKTSELAEAPSGECIVGCQEDHKSLFTLVRKGSFRVQRKPATSMDTLKHTRHFYRHTGTHQPSLQTHGDTPATPIDTLGHTGHPHKQIGMHQPPPWTHWETPATPDTLGHPSLPHSHTRPHTNLAAHIFTKGPSFEQNCNPLSKCPRGMLVSCFWGEFIVHLFMRHSTAAINLKHKESSWLKKKKYQNANPHADSVRTGCLGFRVECCFENSFNWSLAMPSSQVEKGNKIPIWPLHLKKKARIQPPS